MRNRYLVNGLRTTIDDLDRIWARIQRRISNDKKVYTKRAY